MVAGRFERRGETCEDSTAFVQDRRDTPVHQPIGTHDLAAERLADRLMAEADAEHWHLRVHDGLEGDARFVRRAWTRRDEDTVDLRLLHALDVDLVVPHDLRRDAELTEVLHE